MFRKTFIAAATVAALGAGSIAPAAAAGVSLAGGAALSQTSEAPVVQVRHDDRRDRGHRGRDYRHGRDHHRGHGYQRSRHRGQVCQVRPTRVVQWTPRGRIVRIVPRETCFFGGGRRWR